MDGHRPLDGPTSGSGYHPAIRQAAQTDGDLDDSGAGQESYRRWRRERREEDAEERVRRRPDSAISDEPTPLLLQALVRASITGEDLNAHEREQIRALRGQKAYTDISTTRFYRLHMGQTPAAPSEPSEALEPRAPIEDLRAD